MRSSPLLLGHRGTRSSRPVRENTLTAFDLALAHGCDGFEFDVRVSSDGVPIICHDPKYRGAIIAKNPASRLPSLLRFEDVVSRYSDRAFLDIELKVPGLAQQVLSALTKRPPKAGYVVSSFLPEVLEEVRQLHSTVVLGFILSSKRHLPRWRDLHCNYVIPHHRLVTRDFMDEAHAAGKKVLAWTVNGPASMRRLADWGVDGLISDRTELLVRTLKNFVSQE